MSEFINVDELIYTSEVIQDRMIFLRKYLRKYLCDFEDKKIGSQSLESLINLESFKRLRRLNSLERLQSLNSLERLQSLNRLERLQRLNKLDNLQTDNIKFYSDDYQNIPLPDKDAVIYCDIPYANTRKYKHPFNHERFYSWAESQEIPVYISEYEMPKDRFICVAEKEKVSKISQTQSKITVERIFRPRTQV